LLKNVLHHVHCYFDINLNEVLLFLITKLFYIDGGHCKSYKHTVVGRNPYALLRFMNSSETKQVSVFIFA